MVRSSHRPAASVGLGRTGLILVSLLAITVTTASATQNQAPIEIGNRLEPLVDDYLIERMQGASLVLHAPVAREVAINHDQPWEGNVCTYHTVFQDGALYRMYYRGAHFDEAKGKSTHPEVVCYAESRDGITWTKPNLGLFEWEGSKQNNIVWKGPIGVHNFAPFKDANPNSSPEARYKALGSGKGGLYAFQSPDAIHWKLMRDQPVITKGAFDSLNLGFYDTVRSRYVDFHRGFHQGVRDILTTTSSDFLNWSEPEYLTYTGAPREHLYTNAITAYHRAPHLFFGFPKRFIPDRNPANHPARGVSDGVFMSSRDGKRFKRWPEAFLRPGLQASRWVNRNNLIAWGIVETKSELPGAPNELSVYATEDYYRGESCKLRRFTVRLDGFVSARAPYAGGEIITRPLVFRGQNLVLNFSTSAAGSVRVEVQDAEGNPISGFRLEETPEIVGDSVEHVVEWKSGSRLADLAGKPVRLRFVLKDADLYSLRFR